MKLGYINSNTNSNNPNKILIPIFEVSKMILFFLEISFFSNLNVKYIKLINGINTHNNK